MTAKQTKKPVPPLDAGAEDVKGNYTILYSEVEHGWIQANVLELPSVVACGPTKALARDNALDAINEYRDFLIEKEGVIYAQ